MQGDTEPEPMTSGLAARVYEHVFGEPPFPNGVPVTHFEQRPVGSYTPPAPPPADMPVDPDKWRTLSRKRRRELIRYHRKQVRGR